MTDANLNALWCRCIAEELVRAGVREVVLCPGNRNVPLAFAFEAHDGLRVIPHVEERSAAFMALGLSRIAGRPVVVCTTSGSAVANCLPALTEAFHAHLPLLLISADRPPQLQDCEAPQTMQQVGIFKAFLAADLDLPVPAADKDSLIQLHQDVHAWTVRCAGAGGGPGQLNVPLDDPLAPLPDPAFRQPRDEGVLPRPTRPAQVTGLQPSLSTLDATGLGSGMRGLIVAGPRCPLDPPDVARLARATGFPVLADAASGLRGTDLPGLVTTADALVTGPLGDDPAEVLIRLGPAPVARPVYEYCSRHRGPVLRIDRHRVERDFCHRRFQLMVRPGAHELEGLCQALANGDAIWRERWIQADAAARIAHEHAVAALPWGEIAAAATVCAAQGYSLLQVANSMAVRHANLHLQGSGPPRIIAHRGVNGIDGTLGSFIGALHGIPDQPGLLLCGDLAFLHDLPALSAVDQPRLRGTICVIDNGGGGIFDLLPVSTLPGYQRLVRTPRPVDRQHLAAAFGLAYQRCETVDDLTSALEAFRDRPGLKLIEAVVPAASLSEQHAGVIAAMAGT